MSHETKTNTHTIMRGEKYNSKVKTRLCLFHVWREKSGAS